MFDDQIFLSQVRGGISRYFVELIREFSADATHGVDVVMPWRWIRNRHALEAGLGRALPLPGRSRLLRLANRTFPRRSARPEVEHRTFYMRRYLARRSAAPTVVTVYDMIPELFPELFPFGNPHQMKREFVQEADAVICISERTRTDLLQVYGSIQSPIIVTPLGVGSQFRPGAYQQPWLPQKYVLFVGDRHGYKDFPVALESFAEIAHQHDGLRLVLVGGGVLSEREKALASQWGVRDLVTQCDVRDADLPGVYARAQAFVFPSQYEGFGLPTVEAMASGTPVILADSSALPEVGGDAALYFPPGDAAALAALLSQVLGDPAFRKDRINDGRARASAYTWHRTATGTAAAYVAALRLTGSPSAPRPDQT